MKSLLSLALATFMCLTSCTNSGPQPEDAPMRDWNARLNSSAEPKLLDDIGGDYYLFLYDAERGDASAIRFGIRLLASPNASLSALGDAQADLAEVVYGSAYNRDLLVNEFRLLSPDQQRRFIAFVDSASKSGCYRFTDWNTEREELLSNTRP